MNVCSTPAVLPARPPTTASDTDPIYDSASAAGYVGMANATLRRWRALGVGPTFIQLSTRKVGYRRSALDAWLAARERTSTVEDRAAEASS